MASTSNSNCNSQSSSENSSSSNVHQFIGQRLYKHDGKLSKRAQEVTGIPLINYNLQPLVVNNKEPLKRTFSASGASVTTDGNTTLRPNWPWPSRSPNFQPLESMPELPNSKPLLSETLSMPLLQNLVTDLDQEVEIGSGDEERLLPTDLLKEESENESEEECNKPILRKTWSWTPNQNNISSQEIVNRKKVPELSTLRHLERAIKSLSIDPNVSISRKF